MSITYAQARQESAAAEGRIAARVAAAFPDGPLEWGGEDVTETAGAAEMTAGEVASGVEYADVRLYAETCPCGETVAIGDHGHDDHWA